MKSEEERLLERGAADVQRAEIAAGIFGPTVDLAQPLKQIRENQIALIRIRLEGDELSQEQSEEEEKTITVLTQDAKALEGTAMTGEMNQLARESVEGFCRDTEEIVNDVIEGNDSWIDEKGEPQASDLREHYRLIAKGTVSRRLHAETEDAKRTGQYETEGREERSDEDRRKEANRTIGFSTEQFNGVFGFSIPLQRLELGDNLGLREALAKRLDETRKKMTMERGVDRREQKRRFAPQVRSLFEEFAPSSEAREAIRRDFERGMEDPRTAARDEQTDRARQRDRSDRNQR